MTPEEIRHAVEQAARLEAEKGVSVDGEYFDQSDFARLAAVEPVWREARKVQPGWFVRMEGDWHEVRLLMEFGGGSGRRGIRGVRVVTVDGFTADCDASSEVATLTAREAKRAGVA